MNDDNKGNVIEKKSVITFECSKEEKTRFIQEAKKHGDKKLVSWILNTLNKACDKSK